ncbi:MAG: ABC transporter permease [Chloroflexi bacterium]|nr:ABC transporter permease [Chloroflexota bacterium]
MNGWRQRSSVSSRVLTAASLLCLLLAPLVAPFDPLAVETSQQLAAPGQTYLLGTDLLGRDVLSRFLFGGRQSLLIAAGASALAMAFALVLRLTALGSGPVGEAMLDIVNQALLAVPPLVLALTITTLAGRGEFAILLAAGLTQIAPFLRTTLVAERQARGLGQIEAARSLGATRFHLWRFHLLPAMSPVLAASAGVVFAQALLMAAALSFLGFGGEISSPEWGRMLYEGRQVLRVAPWVALAPGIGITLLVIIVNRGLRRLAAHPHG